MIGRISLCLRPSVRFPLEDRLALGLLLEVAELALHVLESCRAALVVVELRELLLEVRHGLVVTADDLHRAPRSCLLPPPVDGGEEIVVELLAQLLVDRPDALRERIEAQLLLADLLAELFDGVDDRLDRLVTLLEGLEHQVLGDAGGAGLDHRHGVARGGHRQVQLATAGR